MNKSKRQIWLRVKCPGCGTYINMVTINSVTKGCCSKCGTWATLKQENSNAIS